MANINIGGRLHSTATGNTVAGANEILDDNKGKKQSVINQEVDAALAGKQATIDDLSAIRSGAAAGATAYQKPASGVPASDLASGVIPDVSGFYTKPASGIPASDIASGVIPTVPTISTDVSADAASDVKTSSPKSVKTYVDGIASEIGEDIEGINDDIEDLGIAIETIGNGAFVVAWDGESTPVAANIPAGVSVTYGGSSYTGSLAADSSTVGKIYLVATGTSGNYDRYVTVGSSTYSWVHIGTTSVALEEYATNSKVNQLEQKVGNFAGQINLPYGAPTGSRYVYWSNGTLTQSGVCSAITDVDVSAYVGKTLYYSRARIPATQGNQGMAFMKADGTFLSGVQGILNASVWGIELSSITIPTGAAKARFTCPTDLLDQFELYTSESIAEELHFLDGSVTDCEGAISDLSTKYDVLEETSSDIRDTLASTQVLTSSNEWQNGTISAGGQTSESSNTIITKKKIALSENAYVRISVAAGYKYRVIFLSAYGTGNIVIPQLFGVVTGDYDDLRVWHTDERILAIPSGSPCYTVTVRKTDESSISPTDCSNVFCHNSYGVELFKDSPSIKDDMMFNAFGLLKGMNCETQTADGITFEYAGYGTFHVFGTATNNVPKGLLGGVREVPNGCEAGKTIYLSGMTNSVLLRVQECENGVVVKTTTIPRPATYTIGATATGVIISIIVRNGTTIDEYVHPIVLNAYSNEVLSAELGDYIKNNRNILDRDTASRTITHNGITYSFDGDKWNVAGTSSSTSWAEILGTNRMIPDGLEAGKLVKVKYSGEDVALHIVQYDSTPAVIQSTMFYSDGIVAIDANAKGVVVRLRVAADVTLDEDVTPVIINHLDEGDVSKELYALQQSSDGSTREEKIVQCAKSYYVMTRANRYTYGERSALYYGDGGDLNQVHCGALCALLASGCPFYSSRYIHPESVNESFAAGYGFDFEAYSLKLAQSGVQSEIDYIGEENVDKSVQELKELMLFKTSYKLSTSCLRWGMIEYIQSGSTIDTSKMRVGDILFYGHPDDGSPKVIDGQLITPVLIEGNLIGHCDTVIEIRNGTPYVIDAGAAPITIHAFNPSSYYTYVCIGRVPLFDIIM